MIISVSNSHPFNNTPTGKKKINEKEVQDLVLKSIEQVGLNSDDIKWNEKGHLELKNPNNLKLHTLTLKMEEMGLDLTLRKQTVIEVN